MLLASLAFGRLARLEQVPTEGIERVEAADFSYARDLGCTVRLLASARLESGRLALEVRPTLVPLATPFAAIRGPFNAVEVRSDALGPMMLVGQGAGALPTGSAVVSDIVEACRNLAARAAGRVPHLAFLDGVAGPELAPPRTRKCPWYLRFSVADEPGVLAQIAGALGTRGISIASLIQRERAGEGPSTVVVVTHEAAEAPVRQAVEALDALALSRGPARLLPIDRAPASSAG